MNEKDTHLELIRRYLDGTATAEETQALEALILRDPAMRREFLRYAHLDAALAGNLRPTMIEGVLRTARQTAQASAKPRPRWLQWRPLWAAAAGLVFGLFSASVVWAYAVPRAKTAVQRTVPIFTESFENPQSLPHRGFPTGAGGWFGDLSVASTAPDEVKPVDGKHMARLAPVEKRKFSYAYRIVDLADSPLPAGATSRQVEVTAAFHGSGAEVADRFQIRLAAFAETPGEIRPIWNDETTLFDRVLQHVGRNEVSKPGHRGWRTLKATMEIPSGTRSLVIALAAAVADESAPKTEHYLDDVHARFIISEVMP